MPFDAATLYILSRLRRWPGLEIDDIKAAERALMAGPVNTAGQHLRDLASTGMPDAIVPFKRSAIDIAYASQLAPLRVPSEFGGDDRLVDTGYFVIRISDAYYVDEVQDTGLHDTRLLDPARVTQFLETVWTMPRRPCRYWVSGEHSGPDKTQSEVLRVLGPWVGPSIRYGTSFKVTLRLLRPQSPESVAIIGSADLRLHQSDLVLEQLKPELLMELQAAALSGTWLQMEHSQFSCFGPLPDLFEPGDGRDIWWHPREMLKDAFGVAPETHVSLDLHTARRIIKHVPWAWIHRPSDHFKAATGAL